MSSKPIQPKDSVGPPKISSSIICPIKRHSSGGHSWQSTMMSTKSKHSEMLCGCSLGLQQYCISDWRIFFIWECYAIHDCELQIHQVAIHQAIDCSVDQPLQINHLSDGHSAARRKKPGTIQENAVSESVIKSLMSKVPSGRVVYHTSSVCESVKVPLVRKEQGAWRNADLDIPSLYLFWKSPCGQEDVAFL